MKFRDLSSLLWGLHLVFLLLVTTARAEDCMDKTKPVVITGFHVPSFVKRGSRIELTCHFQHVDRERPLFMLAWEHNGTEIYRYNYEVQKKFDQGVEGFDIDMEASTQEVLVLRNVSLQATGLIRCYVETGFPCFYGDANEELLTVVVIPEEDPEISGCSRSMSHIAHGEEVSLNCTSPPSLPPADLVWTINGKEADPKYLERFGQRQTEDGLFVTSLGLRFRTDASHFLAGEMTLKCSSRIATFLGGSSEHSHRHHKPKDQTRMTSSPVEGMPVKTNAAGVPHPGSPWLPGLALALALSAALRRLL